MNHNAQLISGTGLIVNQWLAMFKKKYLYSVRNWILFLLQNLIPICFIIISILVGRTMREQTVLPTLDIDLATYEKTVTILDKSYPFESNSTTSR